MGGAARGGGGVGDFRFWPPKNKMKKILGAKTKQFRKVPPGFEPRLAELSRVIRIRCDNQLHYGTNDTDKSK